MHPANFQIKSILHSYETKSPLVYSKLDGCFYSVGSIKELSKKDYETHPQAVHNKIQEFVANNQPFFYQDVLSSLSTTLEKHVQQIVGWTSSILALFYYFFNPQSKSCLVERKHLMEELKSTIDNAIVQLKKKPQIKDDDEIEPEHSNLSQLPHLVLPQVPLPLSPLKSQRNIFGPPLQLSQRQVASPLPPSKSTKVQTPIHVPQPSTPPVPPPPPPPMPQFNLNSYSLPGEPPALSFDPLHYKKLTDDKISEQISLIKEYIQKLEKALEPIQEQVKLRQEIPSSLQDLRKEAQELTSQINRYSENLKKLQEGNKNKSIVILDYKTGVKLVPLPYIPDQIFEEIKNKREELENENKARRLLLETKIKNQKPLLESKEQEFLKNPLADSQTEVENMRKEIQEAEQELELIRIKPTFNPTLLYDSLKIDGAITTFQEALAKLEERRTSIQNECDILEQKLNKLQNFRYHELDLTDLEKIVTAKIKLIRKWDLYKNTREKWLKQKANNKGIYKLQRKGNEENIQPDLVKFYPDLQHLLNLDQNTQIVLKGAKANGKDIILKGAKANGKDIIDVFKGSLYKKFFPEEDSKDLN